MTKWRDEQGLSPKNSIETPMAGVRAGFTESCARSATERRFSKAVSSDPIRAAGRSAQEHAPSPAVLPNTVPVPGAGRSRIDRIDLDQIARSYNRIQVSVRMLRGLVCTIGMGGMGALLFIVMMPFFVPSPVLPIIGIIAGGIGIGIGLGLGLGLEYGRRRLLGGSLRAGVVLSTFFGLLIVVSLAGLLFQIADLGLQKSGAIVLHVVSTAFFVGMFGLLLVGSMEPIRARAQPWRRWCFDGGKFTQTDELFRFIGLPIVPRGRGNRARSAWPGLLCWWKRSDSRVTWASATGWGAWLNSIRRWIFGSALAWSFSCYLRVYFSLMSVSTSREG